MSWSTSGSVATYPTVAPTPATGSSTLTFRAAPGSGIVYVTGTLSPGGYGSGPSFTLPSPFRPLQAVTLATPTNGVDGQPVTVTIGPTGAVSYANYTNGGQLNLRTFYLTDVTPG